MRGDAALLGIPPCEGRFFKKGFESWMFHINALPKVPTFINWVLFEKLGLSSYKAM
jgi:hypothetical protein